MNRATQRSLVLIVGFLSTSASADGDIRRRDVIYCVSGGYRSNSQTIPENYLLSFARRCDPAR
jgi:hypothetical protein